MNDNLQSSISRRRRQKPAACQACGFAPSKLTSRLIQSHHLKPVSAGGSDSADNILYLCPTCHAIANYYALRKKVRVGSYGCVAAWDAAKILAIIRRLFASSGRPVGAISRQEQNNKCRQCREMARARVLLTRAGRLDCVRRGAEETRYEISQFIEFLSDGRAFERTLPYFRNTAPLRLSRVDEVEAERKDRSHASTS